jgi:hypothetical protein
MPNAIPAINQGINKYSKLVMLAAKTYLSMSPSSLNTA